MNTKLLVSLVHDGQFSFATKDHNAWRLLTPVPLDNIAGDELTREDLPPDLSQGANRLLVVPDYWFENIYLPFPSKKKSLIEAFLTRKIAEQYPDTPESCSFFDYVLTQTPERQQGLYVFYLKEPVFFKLYALLEGFLLTPRQVSAPGYLWQRRLAAALASFAVGGHALVHIMQGLCYLAVYFEGNFLFSRLIALPTPQDGGLPPLEEVVYEITQSMYLFSQKIKKEVEHIHVFADNGKEVVAELSPHFRGKLHDLAAAGIKSENPCDERLGPAAFFLDSGLLFAGHLFGVTHVRKRREEEWRRFQWVGIASGAVLNMILIAILSYMFFRAEPLALSPDPALETRAAELEGRLAEYRQSVTLLAEEAERSAPEEILSRLALSLPEEFLLKKATIAGEKGGKVEVEGWVDAADAAVLERVLTEMVAGLHRHIPASGGLQLRDMDFSRDKDEKTRHRNRFLVTFNFPLP